MMRLAFADPPAGFDELPVEEQIDYVQSLWDRIFSKAGEAPAPAWHRAVIDERLAEYEANPDAGRPWEQVEAELLARYSKRQ